MVNITASKSSVLLFCLFTADQMDLEQFNSSRKWWEKGFRPDLQDVEYKNLLVQFPRCIF